MYQTKFQYDSFISEMEMINFDFTYINKEGQTVFFHPYTWTDENIKSILRLGLGLNINHRDIYGRTPLFYNYCKYSFRDLINNGSDINTIDKKGQNLLFYYISEMMIEDFLEMDINFNVVDNEGHTFLSRGLFCKYPDLFMKKRHLMKTKNVTLDKVYFFTGEPWDLLNKNDFQIDFSDNIEFMYNPKENTKEVEKVVSVINNNFLKRIKGKRFYFKGKPDEPAQIYTFDNLSKLIECSLSKG
ncbi:hypothetical protein [Pectobacterium sp. CHL-2024]|uniref:hypothetical protein n=1 Tax=Pectobacterium sp. CHL-2024 TaxID=3377079 RepID=UPI003821D70C